MLNKLNYSQEAEILFQMKRKLKLPSDPLTKWNKHLRFELGQGDIPTRLN